MLLAASSNSLTGEISLFDALVKAGEETSLITLPYQLHNFLVLCLVEHVHDTDIVHEAIALNYLRSFHMRGEHAVFLLRRAGEAALLLAGLFPERARRLNVSPGYFHLVGQSAYSVLASEEQLVREWERREFYRSVVEQFESLKKVLGGTRLPSEPEWDIFLRSVTPL